MAELKFDERGMLISSSPAPHKTVQRGLQFDENGMLVTPSPVAAPEPMMEEQGEPTQEQPLAPSVDVTAETEEGAGLLETIGGGIADVGKGVLQGALNGIEETGETIQWAGETLGDKITGGHDLYIADGWNVEWLKDDEALARDDIPQWQKDLSQTPLLGDGGLIDIPEGPETTTIAGGMASGISQFAAGYVTLGRHLKVGKGAVGALTSGAATDIIAFDAHEDRFSDFLRDNVGLQDPITEYLSADGDDSVLEGKLKNAIEGAGIGLATDGVVRLVKAFKKAKTVQLKDGDEAASAVMNAEVEKIVDDGQLNLFDETTDPNLRAAGDEAGPKRVVKTGRKADAASNTADGPRAEGADSAGGSGGAVDPVLDGAASKPVNTQRLTESINQEIALRNGGSQPNPNRVPESGIFNFDKMDADVDIKDVMNMAADAVDNSTFLKSTSLDEVTNEARAYLAESVDVDPNVIDASLAQMAGNAEKQRAMVVAGKALVQSLAGEVERLAYVIDAGDAGKDVYEKFIRMQARLVETSGNLKATITGAAQATSAGRIRTSDWLTGQELSKADIIKQIDENIAGAGGSTGIDDMARAIILNKSTNGGANGIFKIAEGATGPMRVVNEVWINAILSGPKTHMINIISNAGNTLLFPAEKMLGGAVSLDPAMIKEGARQYAGIVMAVKDSMKLAGQAFVKGRNLLDPEAAILEANGNDFRAIRSNSQNPAVRGLINGVGEIIRFPSRGLLTADEFFKQVNYRSGVYADLVAQADDLVRAGKLNPKQAGKYVADRMATSVAADGSARSPRHIEHAREVTFTQELGTGGGQFGQLSKEIQNMTNRHPALKLILPFVRTPTNILKASVQRTPVLRRLSSTLNADLKSGDPKRVAAARGKMVTGNLMWGAAILAAQEGKLTGTGPTDPQQRKLLMETGWRPNSFVIDDGNGGKRYVEYGRLEPFSMFLGIAADVTEIGGQIGDQELDDLATAALIGFTNNVTSKTYLQGLSDTFAAMSDPGRFLPSLMNRYASSMVPYSSALREARKFKDPALRDVRSMLDAVKNTVPGYSETIPAKRSWITGQVIHYPKGWGADMISPLGEAFASANPITAGDWKQDPVLDELSALDFGLSAPTRKIKGVELDQKQYERLLELHGTIRSGRSTMYQRLEKLFESETYKRLPAEVSDPSVDPRIKHVQKIVSGYRELARRKLMEEYPEIATQVRSASEELSRNARSGFSGIADLAN